MPGWFQAVNVQLVNKISIYGCRCLVIIVLKHSRVPSVSRILNRSYEYIRQVELARFR